jgi:hypothetical protein
MTFDSFRLLNCHPCVISEDSELMSYCWRHTFLGYHVSRLQKIEDTAFNVSSLQSLYFRQNHFPFNKNVNKKYRPKTLLSLVKNFFQILEYSVPILEESCLLNLKILIVLSEGVRLVV